MQLRIFYAFLNLILVYLRRRLAKISTETSSITSEETCLQETTGDNRNIVAEESTHFVGDGAPTQECFSEDSVECTRSNYRFKETEVKEFSCSSCNQTFFSKYYLTMHVFIHIDGVQPPVHICSRCGEVFLSNDRLIKHFVLHTENSQEKCHQQCTVSDEYGRLQSCEVVCVDKRAHKRDVSNKSFTTADGLGSHRSDVFSKSVSSMKSTDLPAVYTGETPYKCNVCEKEFITLDNLKKHNIRHTGDRAHKCDICGMAFTLSVDLKRHVVRHTSDRPHKCNVCGKSYTESSYLERHELTHTGKTPYKCGVCGKSFTIHGHLKTHSLTHTGQRPHKCDVCGKTFVQSGHLKSHKLLHTGESAHKCSVCGKPFSALSHLKKHHLIHTGEKPHKCNVCGKSFTMFNTLKRHALIHVSDRPSK